MIQYNLKLSENPLPFETENICHSRQLFEQFIQFYEYGNLEYRYKEYFCIMLLNTANRPIGMVKISEGSICGTLADPREIMSYMILSGATKLALCHNHPSGNAKPSDADVKLTKKLESICLLFDGVLLDHIIITGRTRYTSLKDENYF